MKTNYLFPHRYKIIGWILFVPSLLTAIVWMLFGQAEPDFFDWRVFTLFSDQMFDNQEGKYFSFITNNWLGELLGLGILIGGILLAFSNERIEDEFIAKIRLESLVWATYVNYAILFLALILIYDMDFLIVMEVNLFTILIFFIIRFRWMLGRAKKEAS